MQNLTFDQRALLGRASGRGSRRSTPVTLPAPSSSGPPKTEGTYDLRPYVENTGTTREPRYARRLARGLSGRPSGVEGRALQLWLDGHLDTITPTTAEIAEATTLHDAARRRTVHGIDTPPDGVRPVVATDDNANTTV